MLKPYRFFPLFIVLAITACTYASRPGQATPARPAAYSSAPGLIGSPVFDRQGIYAGTVQDLLINNETGAIAYVSLKLQDLYLYGRANLLPHHNRLVPLPWRWVRINSNPGHGLTLQASLDALYAAPRLELGGMGLRDEWNADIDRYWAQVK
jgi:sporulation protein YlmC with PRC-barrel domain